MFACPWVITTENETIQGLLRGLGINPEKNQNPTAKIHHRAAQDTNRTVDRKAGTFRLCIPCGAEADTDLDVKEVIVPLGQHIGKPATPMVKVGDMVHAGDLIAEAAEGLSANIHTGFAGIVTEIGSSGIRISKKEA